MSSSVTAKPTVSSSLIILAFAVIYLVWGTTFAGIKLTLTAFPPFIAGGIRMVLAAAVMYLWLRWRNASPLKGVNVFQAALSGLLMIGIGNGLVVWAQQQIPSGIAALVVASVPAFVLLLNWLFYARITPSRIALIGMLIAMTGFIAVIANTRSLSGNVTTMHLIALIAAVIGWSIGTLQQRKAIGRDSSAASVLAFTCALLFFGGVFQLLFATACHEWQQFDVHKLTALALTAMGYLVILGSVVGFTAYIWLLQHVPAQRVATYALVNPLVALVLGALFLNEPLSIQAGLAVLLVLVGVGIVLFEEKLLRKVA
jgi:drug/metabolite transporter (DMT)-like permease